jgi:hypothetical protein
LTTAILDLLIFVRPDAYSQDAHERVPPVPRYKTPLRYWPAFRLQRDGLVAQPGRGDKRIVASGVPANRCVLRAGGGYEASPGTVSGVCGKPGADVLCPVSTGMGSRAPI